MHTSPCHAHLTPHPSPLTPRPSPLTPHSSPLTLTPIPTQVDPAKHYNVAACAAHPVQEHFRVQTFALALTAAPTAAQLPLLGELMYQSRAPP